MSNLRDELHEIWIGTSGVKIDAPEIEQTIALFNKHVEELLPEKLEIRDDQLPNHILYAKGYNQALDDIKAKLKGE